MRSHCAGDIDQAARAGKGALGDGWGDNCGNELEQRSLSPLSGSIVEVRWPDEERKITKHWTMEGPTQGNADIDRSGLFL